GLGELGGAVVGTQGVAGRVPVDRAGIGVHRLLGAAAHRSVVETAAVAVDAEGVDLGGAIMIEDALHRAAGAFGAFAVDEQRADRGVAIIEGVRRGDADLAGAGRAVICGGVGLAAESGRSGRQASAGGPLAHLVL